MVENCGDLRRAEFARMPLAGEKDKAFHPMQVGFFGPVAVVAPPDRFACHVKEPRTRGLRRRILRAMVGHVPLPLKAELPQNLIRGNVLTEGTDDRVGCKGWLAR